MIAVLRKVNVILFVIERIASAALLLLYVVMDGSAKPGPLMNKVFALLTLPVIVFASRTWHGWHFRHKLWKAFFMLVIAIDLCVYLLARKEMEPNWFIGFFVLQYLVVLYWLYRIRVIREQ